MKIVKFIRCRQSTIGAVFVVQLFSASIALANPNKSPLPAQLCQIIQNTELPSKQKVTTVWDTTPTPLDPNDPYTIEYSPRERIPVPSLMMFDQLMEMRPAIGRVIITLTPVVNDWVDYITLLTGRDPTNGDHAGPIHRLAGTLPILGCGTKATIHLAKRLGAGDFSTIYSLREYPLVAAKIGPIHAEEINLAAVGGVTRYGPETYLIYSRSIEHESGAAFYLMRRINGHELHTPEARAIWNSFSPKQQQMALEDIYRRAREFQKLTGRTPTGVDFNSKNFLIEERSDAVTFPNILKVDFDETLMPLTDELIGRDEMIEKLRWFLTAPPEAH